VEELRRALRLDPLVVTAYRLLGYALVQVGRFSEAMEQWEQWERLAPNDERELAFVDEVRTAKSAAQVFAGSRVGGAGGARV
jgi:cytochrome c-type biogenesis protein CcmH/NrfG